MLETNAPQTHPEFIEQTLKKSCPVGDKTESHRQSHTLHNASQLLPTNLKLNEVRSIDHRDDFEKVEDELGQSNFDYIDTSSILANKELTSRMLETNAPQAHPEFIGSRPPTTA